MRGTAKILFEQLTLQQVRQKAELAHREAQLRQLHGLWPRRELQLLMLEVHRLSQDLARTTATATQLAAELDAIRSSNLWRLAAPLRRHGRRLGRPLRQGMRALRLLRHGRVRLALRRQMRADMAVLAGHPLFDHEWYRLHHLDGSTEIDPVAHYLWVGAAARCNPHPLFDTAWYAGRHPDLGLANPFAHYLRSGMAADEDPHPLFDVAYYLAQAPEAAGRALEHYAQRVPGDPRCPTPFFDMVGYQADNPDAATSRLDPVAHFAHVGAPADRDPHALFNTAWYRTTHLGGALTVNPLAHWLRDGAAAGVAPTPVVPRDYAKRRRPDVRPSRTAGRLGHHPGLRPCAGHRALPVCPGAAQRGGPVRGDPG